MTAAIADERQFCADDVRDVTPASFPIRICFPFAGDNVGGSHVSVLGLVRQLDPDRHHAIIVPAHAEGRVAKLFAEFETLADPTADPRQFVPGERFGIRKFFRALRGVRQRARFLKEQRIDIVHVNDGPTSAAWALAARLANVRLVWHHRGDPNSRGLRFVAPLLADRVLAVSTFALPAKGWWSAASKAQVVHSPFDTTLEVDRQAARAMLLRELGIGPDTAVLGFFGAFVPRKRPLLFVDAIAQLQRMLDRPVVGLMFGEARIAAMDEALRARIASSGVGDGVRILGHRTPGPFWIGACDQLLVPAVDEPFGRTLIEAMLVGTPVVAARSGGNVEALEDDNGVLVDADDADALAAGCAALVRDPARARALSERAGEQARHRFGEAYHREQVTAVYAAVIS